jgi:hypothetical protein
MSTIEIDGVTYKLYQVGIGFPAFVYYHVTSREAVAVPAQVGKDPVAVLLEVMFSDRPAAPPRYREVTDADRWRAMTARFRQ